ncbi:DegT/DnrJ/EryC1/StrS family aminotransferase [Gilvibacter sp.]|uniref:DegT/DnrJ/EryC1/StrS family aminotransferase n=1 Tax=Gilvibacter sp. TaxID=2729997 RepID=UPI003F4A275F
MINVTKTFLPPQSEYQAILSRAWENNWITNRGELVKELESRLHQYLGVAHLICMNNGTIPMQIAIRALDLSGEIITTPFSYVATTSSIFWEGCKPVFVDIHPEYLTIDEHLIEAAITENTSAILATHVYGNPCNVEAIAAMAKKHNLKVIYDAAHCFGVKYKGESLFNYGDISTSSFHATKLFHTGEGGAFFCNDKDLFEKAVYLHNFGHKTKESFQGIGINGKMSELQAAMGLAVLPYMSEILEKRQRIDEVYRNNLKGVKLLQLREDTDWNYSYFPVVFPSEEKLKETIELLNAASVFPRRYFYPSLNTLPYIEYSACPVTEQIAKCVLCLPLYHDLLETEVMEICAIINGVQ